MEIKKTKTNKGIVFAQILALFVVPIFLIYFGFFQSFYFRFLFLVLGSLFIYGIIRHEKWSYFDMGIRTDNLKKSILPYFIFTFFGVIFLYIISLFFLASYMPEETFYLRLFAFFIPISFFQEFAFRSFLIPRLLSLYKNHYLVIFINSLLFAFIHIIYPNIDVGLPLSFFGGVFFAYMYLKYPNFLLIGIAHSILNLSALLLGFFVPLN